MKNLYKETISAYNRLGKRYLKGIAKAVPEQRLRFMKMFPRKSRILDIGCAGGRDSKAFAKNGFQVIGIDASRVFIKQAKQYAPGIRFIQKDLRNLTFPANSFDGIWANAVLMHLKRSELPRVLKNFYRLLAPKGIVHVRVKQGRGARLVKETLSENQSRFFSFFSKQELMTLFRKTGFRIIHSAIVKDELKRKNVPWVVVWGQKS